MTAIGDLLGEQADKIVRDSISVGDVHLLPLNQKEGITPKDGQSYRNKFFIVLGFDTDVQHNWWNCYQLQYQSKTFDSNYRLSHARDEGKTSFFGI